MMGKCPLTPRMKRAIEYAIENARAMNHNHVGTEHLLLGLLGDDTNVAAQIILNMGLTVQRIKEEVMRLLGVEFPDNDPLIESCVLCTKFDCCYITQSILYSGGDRLETFINIADGVKIVKEVYKLIAPKCKKYERKNNAK